MLCRIHSVTAVLAAAALSSCVPGYNAPLEPPQKAVITQVFPTQLQAGEAVNMQASDLGNRNPDVHWNFGGGCAPNSIVERSPRVTALAPGSYDCSVSAGGPTFAFTLTVTMPQLPEVAGVTTGQARTEDFGEGPFTILLPGPLYQGFPVTMQAGSAEDIPITGLIWQLPGMIPASTSGILPVVTAGAPGTYHGSVVASNAAGSSEPFPFTYKVLALTAPLMGIPGIDQDNAVASTTVWFDIGYAQYQDQGGPVSSYSWNFGGGCTPATSTAREPFVTATTPGTFHGSVTISNAAGSATGEFTYTIISP